MQHYPKFKLNATQTRTYLFFLTLWSILLFMFAGFFSLWESTFSGLCYYVSVLLISISGFSGIAVFFWM